MQKIFLALVVVSGMTAGQIASAQTWSLNAAPETPKSAHSDARSESTVNNSSTDADVRLIAAAPPAVAAYRQRTESAEMNKRGAAAKVDDSKKNPWWEPRDWTYINNQAP